MTMKKIDIAAIERAVAGEAVVREADAPHGAVRHGG